MALTAISFHSLPPAADPDHEAMAHAPFVYARPGTLEAKSDLPLLTWYETEPTARGRRLRYSIVFTNEDGGTPVDRLMATWGRTTDVEFVYSAAAGARRGTRVLEELHQAKDHRILPFRGRREGLHLLLWVVTKNNMLGRPGLDAGALRSPPRLSVALEDRSLRGG